MSMIMKNKLATWLLNQFPGAREEGFDFLAQVDKIEEENDDEKKERLNELDQTYPFSSSKNYFIVKVVGFVNKKPVFSILLAIGLLYNIAFYSVKLVQAIVKQFLS